jgi:hypothetical protein
MVKHRPCKSEALFSRFQFVFRSDGVGTAASFQGPRDLTTDGVSLYLSDSYRDYQVIRKIKIADATVTTWAGQPGRQVAFYDEAIGTAPLNEPSKILYTSNGIFFVDSTESLRWIH